MFLWSIGFSFQNIYQTKTSIMPQKKTEAKQRYFRYNTFVKPPENSNPSPQPDTASDSRAVSAAPPALLRRMPSVNLLLEQASVRALQATVPARILAEAARSVLEQTRQELLASVPSESAMLATSQKRASAINRTVESEDTFSLRIGLESLAARTVQEALRRHAPSLQPAINATGIILHTGLGRARLAPEASNALLQVAMGHANVEIDRETGQRGSRREHVQGLLCELTGAEDATVVNNCAGAVFLAVNALAAGREVIISRGELVEIGGAFRMPDIIRASGATLVEVGTTNRTRLSDYRNAITERTGLILRCQPSNFAIIGFTEETTTRDLVTLGRERGIPVLDDQGSGSLLSLEAIGIQASPGRASMKGTLRDSVLAGADVMMASGDKLLGGPQAGIILGRREYIERIVSHPLARALRVDKFTLAALEATLRLYRDPEQAKAQIPTLR